MEPTAPDTILTSLPHVLGLHLLARLGTFLRSVPEAQVEASRNTSLDQLIRVGIYGIPTRFTSMLIRQKWCLADTAVKGYLDFWGDTYASYFNRGGRAIPDVASYGYFNFSRYCVRC